MVERALPSRPSEPTGLRVLVLSGAVLLAAFLTFSETLDNYFLGDDYTMVAVNHGRTLREELELVVSDEIGGLWDEQFVRPVRSWSLRFDYAISGLRPLSYHVSDIAAHGATSIAIALLVLLLGGEWLPALLAAMLFLLHPLNVDVTAWNTARDESIGAAAMLLALVLYVRSGYSLHWNRYAIASWILLAVSVFTKEYAVLFPLALVGFGLLANEPLRELWRGWVPYAIVIALFLAARWTAFGEPVGGYGSGHTSFRPDLLASAVGQFSKAWAAPFVESPLRLLLILAGALPLAFGPRRAGSPSLKWVGYWAGFWFLLFLLPTHNLVFTDRHLYVSSTGIAIAVGLLLSRTRWAVRPGLAGVALAGLVLALLPETLAREREYARSALECESALAQLRREAAMAPEGSVFVLVGFPQHHDPPWGFGWSLADALGPPFLPERLDRRFPVVVRHEWRDTAWLNYRTQFPDAPIRVLRWRHEWRNVERLVDTEERLRRRSPLSPSSTPS